ncbi:MAG: tetratricopeptide repeat protein [Phycisphaeraceae bacterium]|nr:tetratricopeptide repeat protein [Phycisphaeraceae bacterium]
MPRRSHGNWKQRFVIPVKARRRLALLMIALALMAMCAAIVSLWRDQQTQRALTRLREQAVTAEESGQPRQALELYQQYLASRPRDVDALMRLARCRAATPEANSRHLAVVMDALKRVLALQPNRADALRMLMNIHAQRCDDKETAYLAHRLLTVQPRDVQAHRCRAVTLARMNQTPEALAEARLCVELDPNDLDARALVLFLMKQSGETGAAIEQTVETWSQSEPNLSNPMLYRAIAARLAGDEDKARTCLLEASREPMTSAALARAIAAQMDEIGWFDLATDTLEQAARSLGDRSLTSELIPRWHHRGQDSRIVDTVAAGEADSDLLGWRALALIQLRRLDDAILACEVLHQRSHDPIAQAWRNTLQQELNPIAQSAAQQAIACRLAAEALPLHPQFQAMLARSWELLDEPELARSAWRKTATLAPVWPDPWIAMAKLDLAAHRYPQAAAEARQAIRLAPDNADAGVALACAVAGAVKDQDHAMLAEAWSLLDRMASEPRTATAVLTARIRLMLRTGMLDEAAHMLRKATNADAAPLPQDGVMSLIDLSRRHGLAQETILLECDRRWHGVTPRWAMMQAMTDAAITTEDGRLARFDAWQMEAKPSAPLDWDLARVQLMETQKLDAAAGAWIALADQHPHDLRVQRLALDSPTASRDAAFMERAVQRLRELTGEEGLHWRLARAGLDLRGDVTDAKLLAAGKLLHESLAVAPHLASAHRLLAVCMQRIGSTEAAIEQLKLALASDPADADAAAMLLRLQPAGAPAPSGG